MTQHWADIDNTSLVLVWGANPAENHPACMAHINAARGGLKKAKLVVVDPRLTRTARQIDPNHKNALGAAEPDLYVRIRPGTDIAFGNGVLSWIFNNAVTYKASAWTNMLAWHNGTAPASTNSVAGTDPLTSLRSTRTFVDDTGLITLRPLKDQWQGAYYSATPGVFPLATGYPKYADTRFLVNATATDYQRDVLNIPSSTSAVTSVGGAMSNFPIIAVDVTDPACVFQKLKAHVAAYTLSEVAGICGCTQDDITNVAKAIIDHSRFSSTDFGVSPSTPQVIGYKATTILYAKGQTQHTCASQNIKNFAIIQTLMGNMGRAGGGINALRGIHNVQGSTDFGVLYDSIPGYSANPAAADDFAHTLNGLFGNRTLGAGAKVVTTPANLGLQQRGFSNMTTEWFGDGKSAGVDIQALYDLWPKGNGVQHIKSFRDMTAGIITASVVWGQNPCISEPNQTAVRSGLKNLDLLVCVDTFLNETAACDRKTGGITYMLPACSYVEEAGSVTNSGRWLQWRERATKPFGDTKSDLELLMRLAYALDNVGTFAHILTKWGTLATPIVPKTASHAYAELFGKYTVADPYSFTAADVWFPGKLDGSSNPITFDSLSGPTEIWRYGMSTPDLTGTAHGSDFVAENAYKEICRPLNQLADGTAAALTGGTMWIYSGSPAAASTTAGSTLGVGGYNGSSDWNIDNIPAGAGAWQVKNRAKSRNNTFKGAAGTLSANNYPRWGWAWLYNRRVFYNNGEISVDQSDTFVSPGLVSCLFTIDYTAPATAVLADWSLVYRKYKQLNDRPNVVVAANPNFYTAGNPHFVSLAPNVTFAGQFPAHTEPYESPSPALSTKWGINTSKGTSLLLAGTAYVDGTVGKTVADFPLVLTTIRCVEHFQGGPITRNNTWNVEAEPVPWIEINSVDARTYNINDGDWVNVITARSNTKLDMPSTAPNAAAGWSRGFKARVGVGLQSNQRVAPGVVAIPWHWGEKGLSTGSRANDHCIDAFDPNTQIPEYKACLCIIRPMSL